MKPLFALLALMTDLKMSQKPNIKRQTAVDIQLLHDILRVEKSEPRAQIELSGQAQAQAQARVEEKEDSNKSS